MTDRFAEFTRVINGCKFDPEPIIDMLKGAYNIYLIGNGGSAGIAGHIASDLLKNGRLKARTLHDVNALTCFANDFGYADALDLMLGRLQQVGDVLIVISSSGNSPNVCRAAKSFKRRGGPVITFTGFDRDNTLSTVGDINVWLDSHDYGMVEIGHLFLLHGIADYFHENKTV